MNKQIKLSLLSLVIAALLALVIHTYFPESAVVLQLTAAVYIPVSWSVRAWLMGLNLPPSS